eukprot:scaffold118478_cov62-Cyclotella_meneghiniana.AAC.6
MELVEFRRKLSGMMIRNPWLPTDYGMDMEEEEERLHVDCEIITAPPHACEYRNRNWVCTATSKFQQYVCKEPGWGIGCVPNMSLSMLLAKKSLVEVRH